MDSSGDPGSHRPHRGRYRREQRVGYKTSAALALHGATVVMACRDEGRCSAAADRIRAVVPTARVEPTLLDLADLDSVRAFADRFAERHDTLDILVNNAGVMAPPERLTTKQGFELQFGTNLSATSR